MSRASRALDATVAYLNRFVAFPGELYVYVVALWIMHTYLIDEFDHTGRLAALSPEPASGKSRLIELIAELAFAVLKTINATPAAIFRHIEQVEGRTTMSFDEIDTVYSSANDDRGDLTGIINSGYRRGEYVLRTIGEDHTPKQFPVFAPVALAGLSRAKLPDQLLSRCFIIPMKRRPPGQSIEPFRQRLEQQRLTELRGEIAAGAEEIRPGIAEYFPTLPDGVADRQMDIWEPLVAVADKAGGHWPETARRVCAQMNAEAAESKPSLGTQLLMDIRDVFEQTGRSEISTGDLIDQLCEFEESPWADWYGRPISSRKIAEILKEYSIKTTQFRSPTYGSKIRGFRAQDFDDAFARYLGQDHPGEDAGHVGNAGQGPESQGSSDAESGTGPGATPGTATGVEPQPASGAIPGHGTDPGQKQPRNHGDVPHIPDDPEVPQRPSKGARECPEHGTEYQRGGCFTCDAIHGDEWSKSA